MKCLIFYNFMFNYRIMKTFFIFIFFLNISCFCTAQSLSQVLFSNGSGFSSFYFLTDQKVVIKVSQQGSIAEWGIEAGEGRYYNDPAKLQPYMGRVEYYGTQFDSSFRGKVKSIGTCPVTYYSSFERAELVGKIKSIGTMLFDYYPEFENELIKGKLKTAGPISFSYYSSFENESIKGKLKSVGANNITYFSSFDDKLIRGKIKSIGSYNYAWYTSFESNRFHGGLKTGSRYQMIDGINYVIF